MSGFPSNFQAQFSHPMFAMPMQMPGNMFQAMNSMAQNQPGNMPPFFMNQIFPNMGQGFPPFPSVQNMPNSQPEQSSVTIEVLDD